MIGDEINFREVSEFMRYAANEQVNPIFLLLNILFWRVSQHNELKREYSSAEMLRRLVRRYESG